MKTRNIIAVVAILGLAGATPWISNGMTALSREVSESSAIQLIEKGCTDLGVVEVKTSTVQIGVASENGKNRTLSRLQRP